MARALVMGCDMASSVDLRVFELELLVANRGSTNGLHAVAWQNCSIHGHTIVPSPSPWVSPLNGNRESSETGCSQGNVIE